MLLRRQFLAQPRAKLGLVEPMPRRAASAIARRIEQTMVQQDMTAAELGRRAGLAKGTVDRLLNGERQRPYPSTLEKIADVLGTTVDVLLGRAPLLETNVVGPESDLHAPLDRRLPVYLWGTAGDPTSPDDSPMPDRLEYPPVGREPMVGRRGFGVVVRGTSMTDFDIHDGDTVWINPDAPRRYGMAVLAHVVGSQGDSGMVVKEYGRAGERDCLRSASDGDSSPVACDEFKVIGPVVWIVPCGHVPRRIRTVRSA